MNHSSRARSSEGTTARTIRFPARLREKIVEDAARCGRSFEAHVLALLRRHYGESVDILPTPDLILSRARESMAGIAHHDRRFFARLVERDEK